jgi:acyl-CoA thioester hydrolase
MEELLAEFPVVIELPVSWGEMDAFHHVNNIIYFRYFESCRMKYFEKIDYASFIEKGIGMILASTSCKYRIPLTYPDTVSVGTRITKISYDRYWMSHRIVSHKHGKIAAEGEGVLVSFDYNENKKTVLPGEIKERILILENNKVELV